MDVEFGAEYTVFCVHKNRVLHACEMSKCVCGKFQERARAKFHACAREAVREIVCQNCKIHRVRDVYSEFIKCTD